MATAARATKPKKNSGRNTGNTGNPRRPSKQKPKIGSELKYLIFAGVGLLMALSVYIPGSIGALGRFISNLALGLFGFGAFLLPPIMITIACYGLLVVGKNPKKKIPTALIIKAACLFWIIIAFMHVLTVDEVQGLGFWSSLQLWFRDGSGSNGGLLGGLLGNLLRGLLNTAGAYIVLILSALACMVLLTGRSLGRDIGNIWESLRSNLRYDSDEDEYDDYEYEDEDDDYEEYEEEYIEPARALKPLPKRPNSDKPINRHRGNVLDIRDAVSQRDGKILLFHEEIDTGKARNKVLPFKMPDVMEHDSPYVQEKFQQKFVADDDEDVVEEIFLWDDPSDDDPPNKDTGPTLKGLVEKRDISATATPSFIEDRVVEKIEIPASIASLAGATPTRPAKAKRVAERPSRVATAPASKKDVHYDTTPRYDKYEYPSIEMLGKAPPRNPTESRTQILENSRILEETLRSFKVEAKVVEVSVGPTVTRYDLAPAPGVKVATISKLSNDLALSLAAQEIRIEAPIPGKAAVGIEIPNKEPQSVFLRDILDTDQFMKFSSNLAFAIGKDIAGAPVVTDVARMPHLLIAGATGAGKSVCINTLIASILYKAHPDDVKLLMVDPKVVELSLYNGIPHLLAPVVTDPKKASDALQWAVGEMEQRYERFAAVGVRDLKGYNHHVTFVAEEDDEEEAMPTMPQILIIIDELADLMMTCKGAVEESICRLAQKARAAGIHMVVATQRPSVDVITGLIKANIPSRLAFAVSSGTDSRTVLDQTGAEKLLGKGDMLFLPVGQNKPTRLQGGFISDREVESLVEFLKEQTIEPELGGGSSPADGLDEFFLDATEFLIEKGKGSTSMLQRRFRIGYNRASLLMDELEAKGIVGPEDGVKPRKVLINWEEYQTQYK